jgi:LPXTG-motif cell wall-anchored protein
MPNAVVVSGSTVQIQPSFLLAAVEALAETVVVDETAIVRFRIGSGAWQEATVADLRTEDSPLDIAASDTTGDLEIQVMSAVTEEPLGVVSFDFEVTDEGVNLTIQKPSTDSTPIFVGIGIALLLGSGLMFGFLRRRKGEEESPLTSV